MKNIKDDEQVFTPDQLSAMADALLAEADVDAEVALELMGGDQDDTPSVGTKKGSRKKKSEPEKKFDPGRVASVEERMADKEYVKQLDAQRDQQKQLAKLMAQATNDADRAAVEAALEKNRQETMRLIRERMRT